MDTGCQPSLVATCLTEQGRDAEIWCPIIRLQLLPQGLCAIKATEAFCIHVACVGKATPCVALGVVAGSGSTRTHNTVFLDFVYAGVRADWQEIADFQELRIGLQWLKASKGGRPVDLFLHLHGSQCPCLLPGSYRRKR